MLGMNFKDDNSINFPREPQKIRKGRFLWMDPASQRKYLRSLGTKIKSGYYFSDIIISQIVEDIAPVVRETFGDELIPT
jgi:hypothetical protein